VKGRMKTQKEMQARLDELYTLLVTLRHTPSQTREVREVILHVQGELFALEWATGQTQSPDSREGLKLVKMGART
jgi:hypothetical protein